MTKIILNACILMAFCLSKSYSQELITQSGNITFKIIAPASSELRAENDSFSCSMNLTTGNIFFKVYVAGFHFTTSYMPDIMNASASQRFQNYYFDSKTYPIATFKGNAIALKNININQDGVYPITSSGTMTMRGISRELTASGTITVKKGTIKLSSLFSLDPRDYKVRIPEGIERFYMKEVDLIIQAKMITKKK